MKKLPSLLLTFFLGVFSSTAFFYISFQQSSLYSIANVSIQSCDGSPDCLFSLMQSFQDVSAHIRHQARSLVNNYYGELMKNSSVARFNIIEPHNQLDFHSHSSFNVCGSTNSTHRFKTDFLILILSAKGYLNRRNDIRSTWMREVNQDSQAMARFVLTEQEVEEEDKQYGDFLVIAEKIHYQELVLKTFALLKWAHCHVEFSHLLKTDDDSYVNVNYLLARIRTKIGAQRVFLGHFWSNSSVVVENGNPWSNLRYVKDTGLNMYPYYPSGAGFVLSSDVVQLIITMNSLIPLRMWPNEDVSLATWILGANITRYHSMKIFPLGEYILYYKDSVNSSEKQLYVDPIICSRSFYIIHHVDVRLLFNAIRDSCKN
eukprot:Sdes_comp10406_c0_seq1m2067